MTEKQTHSNSLKQRLAALSPEQRELFERRVREQQAKQGQLPRLSAIVHQPRPQLLPLSAAQLHLWFLHQLDPNNPAYNIPMAWRFVGELNIPALSMSLNGVIERHESLRTRFYQSEDGTPYQAIAPHLDHSLEVLDLRQEENPEQAAKTLVKAEARQPFDLNSDSQAVVSNGSETDLWVAPLLRSKLLRISDRESILILILHHIAGDGWSRGILLREMATLYRGFCGREGTGKLEARRQGDNSLLVTEMTPLPIQYADFARWQQQWLQSKDYQQQLDYWKQQLADLPPLDLPITGNRGFNPHPISSGLPSQTYQCNLSVDCLQGLKALSRQEGTTLFMTLLAGFKLLLYRYTSQTDFGVGVPVACRNQPEIESLIGFFVNTVVIRSPLALRVAQSQPSGHLKFREFLHQVRKTASAAFQHQEVPFAKVVEALQPERSLDQNPLFQVMFQLQNYQLQNQQFLNWEDSRLSIEQMWIDPGATKFEMTWHAIERGDELLLVVEYRSDRFNSEQIESMARHFQQLLTEIVKTPDRCLGEFMMLTPQEYQTLVIDWNQTTTAFPHEFVHQWFEQQAEKTPAAIALREGQQTITYEQLNHRANQLAHLLIEKGVSPDTLVGLCLQRSIDLVVALLGILKAGGAYIPLDPNLPLSRLQFMLDDTQAKLLLTNSSLEVGLQPQSILYLDRVSLSTLPTDTPQSSLTPENLAYVIYTSGSTGTPKGTLINHLGLSNYLHWCLQAYPCDRGRGSAVQSSLGFDATITSLYSPLLTGGCVELLPEGIETLSQILQDDSQETPLSLLKLTPAHLRGLQPLIAKNFQAPYAWVVGGEALRSHDVAQWLETFPHTKIINEYGPTEAVVGCCTYTIPNSLTTSEVPIGHPISNVQLYVLDTDLNPVPVEVPGELYIGGMGVARGYLNRPELTAQRFIPNPFGTNSSHSQTLYRTGDRVRYRRDGLLEYLGRYDEQIKLRGFRIEPGEIITALTQHSAVAEAEVLLQTTPAGVQQLVAYGVLEGNREQRDKGDEGVLGARAEQTTNNKQHNPELLAYLSTKLPSYMLPAQIVILEAFPLTANGKLDRAKLMASSHSVAFPPVESGEPSHPSEKILTELWRTVLKQDDIGIHDNFFDRGGDSILAMQIIARANQQGLQLSAHQLFKHQTIAALAQVTTLSEPSSSATETVVTGVVPLTPIQQDFFAQKLPEPHHYNQAVMLEVASSLRSDCLQQALDSIWHHHDGLRMTFERVNSEWKQFNQAPDAGRISLVEIDLSHLSPKEQADTLSEKIEAFQRSFNLTQTPLFQAILFRLVKGNSKDIRQGFQSSPTQSSEFLRSPVGEQGARLLLISHHLIIDGISWRVLWEDLHLAYEQSTAKVPIKLPPKTLSFQDWSHYLLTDSKSEEIKKEIPYWEKVCQPPVPSLPLDNPECAQNLIADQVKHQTALSPEQTRILLQEIPKLHHTQINDLLLTALGHCISQWNQEKTVLIDLESQGRVSLLDQREINLSRTVGWFTSLYPLRLIMRSGALKEQLQAVKEQLRQVPNQGIGYGVLKYLCPQIDAKIESSSQICFNYLGQIDPEQLVTDLAGQLRSPLGQSRYLLDLVAWVAKGQLIVTWRYSQKLYKSQTIQALAQRYLQILESLIRECQTPEKTSVAPSDFAGARVNQDQLNKLLGKLQGGGS